MARPIVSLLTDFGLRDPSAAICRGVILSIAPEAEIIDISHEVPRFSVRDGAYLLSCALPYLPVGIHVGVVDPGVGTERRPIVLRTGRGDILIGPDNGLLLPAVELLGGLREARVLEAPEYRLPAVSASFHGRDIFAPAAAHVARGVALSALGPPVAAEELVRLAIPAARVTAGRLEASVLHVDAFGNVKFTAQAADLAAALGPLAPGDRLVVESAAATPDGRPLRLELAWAYSFGGAATGAPLLWEDSYGRLGLAVNRGDAAARYGLGVDRPVVITRG